MIRFWCAYWGHPLPPWSWLLPWAVPDDVEISCYCGAWRH